MSRFARSQVRGASVEWDVVCRNACESKMYTSTCTRERRETELESVKGLGATGNESGDLHLWRSSITARARPPAGPHPQADRDGNYAFHSFFFETAPGPRFWRACRLVHIDAHGTHAHCIIAVTSLRPLASILPAGTCA